MKRIAIALALFISLTAHTCNENTADAIGDTSMTKAASLLGSKWVLQTVEGNVIKMPEGIEKPWVKLVKEGSKVEGSGGCNNLFGGFELDGDAVKFPNLASTKKYCEAIQPTENAFMGALRSTDHFKLDGSTLKLFQGTRELVELQPE